MLPALLIGAVVLLASLVSYGLATAVILRVLVRLRRSGFLERGPLADVAAMVVVTFITAAAHLAQIVLWAVAVRLCGAVPTFEDAFYFSAENYTALGYGDLILPGRWRILGPLEAINGLLLLGLSTAMMFAVMDHLIIDRLRFQSGYRDEGARGREPTRAAGSGPPKGAMALPIRQAGSCGVNAGKEHPDERTPPG
jgi:hypothetical protein